jgi:RNA polymerase sigma factor (sigma-70 family)
MSDSCDTDGPGREDNVESLGEVDFREIYDRFYPEIYRYFFHKTHDREVSEDLAAATFQVFWERPRELTSLALDRHRLLHIAFRLQSHHWRAVTRQHQLIEKLSGLGEARGEVAPDETADDLALLAVPGLRPLERAALQMIYWDGKTTREAAEELQCSRDQLKVTLYRARRKLEAHLGATVGSIPKVLGD